MADEDAELRQAYEVADRNGETLLALTEPDTEWSDWVILARAQIDVWQDWQRRRRSLDT